MSVIIYQEHIKELERELIQAKEEIVFLKEQLEVKTYGLPEITMLSQVYRKETSG
tara:strand:+ start:115 stop:279 length:165 start_codon:yes stop_codon:yes gene_type:complete